MNTIFEPLHTEEILKRIDNLSANSQTLWGKMDVAQMLAHCSSFQDIPMGKSTPPRGWLGIFVGGFAKPIFYNDKPLPYFEIEREKLKQQITTFQKNGPVACSSHPHPFFGKLSPKQWGRGIFKHLDHHLKQFGV